MMADATSDRQHSTGWLQVIEFRLGGRRNGRE